ncbi:IclR family transcriptional regulator [Deinococcus sonorensis]|uniref:IclR family transcriptional regulator n=2 Tax=Deinococcus sonorensis TaxID=309891 RepID=A0AAU7UE45_9DEIO
MTTTDSPRRPGRRRTTGASPVRTLERGLHVLSVLGAGGAATLSDLSRRAGLSASTASRLLQTLEKAGYAEWDAASGQWRVGLGAYRVGAAYVGGSGLTGAADPAMQRLVAELGETCNLAVVQGGEAVYIHQVEGRQLVRMFTTLGAGASLHATGVGKALMAWQPPEEVRARLGGGPYPALTPHTLTTLAQYLESLEAVRQQGYALDDQERELGVRCVAAPVHDAAGRVVAALSVSAPTTRLSEARVPETARRVREAAAEVSRRLGYGGPP